MSETAKARWYRLTPDRLVLVLLAVEGLLWLSQRFRWFPFNEHKGWTVLVAVAGVGVFVLRMFLWFVAALAFRWRFQYSIRSLLVLMVAVAAAFGRLETEMKAARRQRETVEWIEKTGGSVRNDYQLVSFGVLTNGKPPGPAWLRKLVGDDLLVNVRGVWLTGPERGDAGLEHLKGLTQLIWLYVCGPVADGEWVQLKALPRLQYLGVCRQGGDIPISDAGLNHLKELTHLRILDLNLAGLTDAGVQDLRRALPKTEIAIDHKRVPAAHLEESPSGQSPRAASPLQ